MATVDQSEVLLLWRAVASFRSGARPECQPKGRPPRSPCPMFSECPRWRGPDDRHLSFDETFDEAERRRSAWPCSRLLDLLAPDIDHIGRKARG